MSYYPLKKDEKYTAPAVTSDVLLALPALIIYQRSLKSTLIFKLGAPLTYLVLWFHGKFITSALREAGRSSARKEAADGGDEEAEGIFGYLCLLYDSQPHPTWQCSVASFATVPVSAKSGLSNFGTVDFSSDGILN